MTDERKILGFVLDNGVFTTVEFPGARPRTVVFDMNDEGRLAGAYDLLVHGYLRDERGEFTTIDAPNVVTETSLGGINNGGQIVGRADTEGLGSFRAFLRDRGGRFQEIDVPGVAGVGATKINDRGQVVGVYSETVSDTQVAFDLRGFLFDRGQVTRVDVPSASFTQPFRVNDGRVPGDVEIA